MRYLEEFQQTDLVKQWTEKLHAITTQSWNIMEVCGGQTHSIVKYGIQDLIPPTIHLIHGPGCPVCVTPIHLIDHAIHIAGQKNAILCSYGDMLRVPGTDTNLLSMKAKGSDIRIVLSPLDAVTIAQENPEHEVVFFAVGFETTAPPNGMALLHAKRNRVANFSLLVSHVLVPPALNALFRSPGNQVQGVLAAGHVCTVMGESGYHPLAKTYNIPIVITGFEPLDILQGLTLCVQSLENGEATVQNQYKRSVRAVGNPVAQSIMTDLFQVVDQTWRGLGTLPQSGLALKKSYQSFDATHRFPLPHAKPEHENGCISGLILKGEKRPSACPHFKTGCTPETPLGAPMVSTEGTCAAYYHYAKRSS